MLWRTLLLMVLLVVLQPAHGSAPQNPKVDFVTGPLVTGGYPEFRVKDRPFFPYVAAFYYHRIPADEWAPALVRLREIGFNTMDLYVIWNWHQPTEEVLDLDGHTNPRRNLKGLLETAKSLGLKVILRPGPYIFNEWRNGGYPDWLLSKPGFGMSEKAIKEGWFPPPSSIQYLDSESASQMWIENKTHWEYTARWFDELWKVVGPYSATQDGPIIAVQMDDDLAIGYYNYNGPKFWNYVQRNEELFKAAGVDVPLFTNAAFMRVTAEASAPPTADPLWIIGQWYLRSGTDRVEREDVASLQWAVEMLKTQPQYPAMMIEFNTNQYAGPLETHAQIIAPPRDTLLAARVLYQNGLRGMTIYPAQDTLYPAGWEFPPANYHYAWESALDISLREDPERAWALRRDGALISGLGQLLAATHEQADVGLLYTLGAYPQQSLDRRGMMEYARRFVTLQQLLYHARVNTEYLDLMHQPAEHLARYPMLFLPAAPIHIASGPGKAAVTGLEMDEGAQRKLLDYVRAGGTLVVLPEPPVGRLLKPFFPAKAYPLSGKGSKQMGVFLPGGRSIQSVGGILGFGQLSRGMKPVAFTAEDKTVVGYSQDFGQGRVVVLGFDFFTWVPQAPIPTLGKWDSAAKLTPQQQREALAAVDWLLGEGRVQRHAEPLLTASDPLDEYLYTTLQVSNQGGQDSYGLLAATNWSDDARRSDIRVFDPRTNAQSILPQVYVSGRDSILLPLRITLNALTEPSGRAGGFSPREEILYATAEVRSARFADRILTLDIYAPGPSEIALRLDYAPLGNCESAGRILKAAYDAETHVLKIEVPPGHAPDYRREVRVPYFPLQPVFAVEADRTVLSGQALAVRVRVNNPGEQPLDGRLGIQVPEMWSTPAEQTVHLPPGGQLVPVGGAPGQPAEFSVKIPEGVVAGSTWTLRACVEGPRPACSEPHEVRIVSPPKWRLTPRVDFPVREDTRLETWPPLASVSLPGQIRFDLFLTNPLGKQVDAQVDLVGDSLHFEISEPALRLDPGKEERVSLTVFPRPRPGGTHTTTGLYPFTIHVTAGGHTTAIPVNLIGIRRGETLVYPFDFDRDGFDDIVLENEALRAIVMPGAGGRAFALVDKATGRNALNTVGGLRDALSKHPRDYTWQGKDLRRVPWRWPELRLDNRTAAVKVLKPSGPVGEVEFSYAADDAYPDGVLIRKRISLDGSSRVLVAEYEVTPTRGDKEQTFRSGVSTSLAGQPGPTGEFLIPDGTESRSLPFNANTVVTLPNEDLSERWLAVSNPERGNLLGLFWDSSQEVTIRMQRFSTLIEIISEPLSESRPYRWRLGYCISQDWNDLRRSHEWFSQTPDKPSSGAL